MEEEIASIADRMGRAMVRGFCDEIQQHCEEVYMEKIDWEPWTQLAYQGCVRDEIPDRKVGQIWVNYGRVVQILTPATGFERCRQEVLAYQYAAADLVPASFLCAYLIQDVGQEQPTPPELCGKTKTKETAMGEMQEKPCEELDWSAYLPPKDKGHSLYKEQTLGDLKKGDVYAYWWNEQRQGVWMCTSDGSSAGKLLAHSLYREARNDWTCPEALKAASYLIRRATGWVGGFGPQAHKRPAPTSKPNGVREVSVDGQQYIDYDKMADSDPFEKYRWHRVRMPDGTFSLDEKPVMLAVNAIDHCYHCGSKQGPFGYANECFPCHGKKEGVTATEMRKRDAANGSRVRSATVATVSLIQSHSMLWGGVFSLRE